jgi:hypothetical protein
MQSEEAMVTGRGWITSWDMAVGLVDGGLNWRRLGEWRTPARRAPDGVAGSGVAGSGVVGFKCLRGLSVCGVRCLWGLSVCGV